MIAHSKCHLVYFKDTLTENVKEKMDSRFVFDKHSTKPIFCILSFLIEIKLYIYIILFE